MTDWLARVQALDDGRRRRLASRLGVDKARLVAFAAGASHDDLKEWLARRLPRHALPDLVVPLDALPRLPSGKVDRRRLLARLPAQNAATDSDAAEPGNDVESRLAHIWAELLDIDRVGLDEDFFELGGDSLVAIRMVSMARQAGLRLAPADLADHRTIRRLALQARQEEAPVAASAVSEAPLLPIQAWHLTRGLAAPHHWNQQVRLKLRQQLGTKTVDRALAALVARHPGLGVSIVQDKQIAGTEIRLGGAPISLGGPLVRAELEGGTLVLTANHLVVDAVSWAIILEDLDTLLTSLGEERDVVSLPAAVSSLQWAQEVASYAQSGAAREDVAPWLDMAHRDPPRDPGTEGAAGTLAATLEPEVTAALLGPAKRAFNSTPLDLMIWALAEVLHDLSGQSVHRIDLESHGRQPHFSKTDLTRTVGWLTDFYPADIVLAGEDIQRGKAVKEALRRFSASSAAFSAVRHLGGDPDFAQELARRQRTEILFNYLGRVPRSDYTMFLVEDTPAGGLRAAANQRSHLFEFNVISREGSLVILLTFGRAQDHRREAEELMARFQRKLVWVVETCGAADEQGFTPADFPDAGMSQDELDRFLDGL